MDLEDEALKPPSFHQARGFLLTPIDMPHFSNEPKTILGEVDSYLSRGPVGQCTGLEEIPHQVSKFVSEDGVETAEKIVRLLGTAVGQQSENFLGLLKTFKC